VREELAETEAHVVGKCGAEDVLALAITVA
jgi:hypothetical protein